MLQLKMPINSTEKVLLKTNSVLLKMNIARKW